MDSYSNSDCPCSTILLAGTNYDGRYSLIRNPGDNPDAGRTIYQAISGKYLYSLYSSYWLVGDDYTSSSNWQNTGSTVDCPTELTTWSATCAPPAAPPFMGYLDYSCPCSEVTLAGAAFAALDGTYSLIQNPENSVNNGKPVYQHSTFLVNNKPVYMYFPELAWYIVLPALGLFPGFWIKLYVPSSELPTAKVISEQGQL